MRVKKKFVLLFMICSIAGASGSQAHQSNISVEPNGRTRSWSPGQILCWAGNSPATENGVIPRQAWDSRTIDELELKSQWKAFIADRGDTYPDVGCLTLKTGGSMTYPSGFEVVDWQPKTSGHDFGDVDSGRPGWIGIGVRPPSDGSHGEVIAAVTPSGPAEKAGIRNGDIIRKVNGIVVTPRQTASYIIANSGANKPISVEIERSGRNMAIQVVTGARPSSPQVPRATSQGLGENNNIYIFGANMPQFSGSGYTSYYTTPNFHEIVAISASNESEAIGYLGKEYGPPKIVARLDNDKCKTGIFLIGWNEFISDLSPKRMGISSYFVHCGFDNMDQAIKKGVLDSGKPFFHWTLGKSSAKKGVMIELSPYIGGEGNLDFPVCEYKDGQWVGSLISSDLRVEPIRYRFCDLVAGNYPILVDREPQEILRIVP